MASPMRWFRRHQKLMMVFFGVGLMAVFGLGSVVSMINPSDLTGGRDKVPVIATWKGGEITRTDLDNLRYRHFQTMRFLDGLRDAAAARKGDNFQSLAIPISRVVQGNSYNQDDVDRRLLDKFLMAELAKEEGIIVDAKMVDEYLERVRGYVPMSRNDLVAINREVNQGQAAMEMIRRQLQLELAAQQMNGLVSVTIAGATPSVPRVPNPSDAIELYSKSNQRIECQALPIDVDIDAISDSPSSAELLEIFEKGKYTYPQVSLSTPGFKIGKKIRAQYFVANRDNFMQNEINKLTDAEVQEEYDRLVAAEDPIVMELVPLEQPAVMEPAEKGTDNDESAPDEATGNDDSDAAPTQAEKGDATNDEVAPETDDAAEKDAANENSEDGSTAADAPDETSSGDDDGLSFAVTENAERYVSAGSRQDTEEHSEEKTEEKSATDADESSTQESESPMPEETEPDGAQAESKVDKPENNTAAERLNTRPNLPGLANEAVDQKRRPKALTECVQEVKESMKLVETTNAIKKALDRADAEIGAYRMRFTRWKFTDEATRGDEPELVDSARIADKYNLEFRETDLVDINDFTETEIGQVRVFRQVMGPDGRPQPQFPSLAQIIFANFQDMNEFDPTRETDMTSTYSFWLAEKTDARIPELNDVKEQVIKFWKHQKALEAATVEAQSIAAKINSSNNQTLTGLYPEKAISTGEFSWFNSAGGQPRISEPFGTEDVGEEFMKTAFSLEQYKAGVAANMTRDTVYIIQQSSPKTSLAESGKDYLENRFFRFKTIPSDVRNISMWYTLDLYRDWNEEFAERMGLKLVGQ